MRRQIVPLTALACTALACTVAFVLGAASNVDRPGVISSPMPTEPTLAERPVAALPWQGEVAHASSSGPSPLSFLSPMAFEDARETIDSSLYDDVAGQNVGQTAVIDGSSLDAMVNSINAITEALPEIEGRAFQKAVRVVMVANLPMEQLRAQNTPIEKVSEQMLIAGAQRELAGKTPLQVLLAAQAKIEAVKADRSTRASKGVIGGSTPLAQ